MSELRLTGLMGSHPLGALAAFGLLRCCNELDDFQGSKLGWDRGGGWVAVLATNRPASPEQLVEGLVARQKERFKAPELNWADTLKTGTTEYSKAAIEAKQRLNEERRDFADFLTAFACELSTDRSGRLEPRYSQKVCSS